MKLRWVGNRLVDPEVVDAILPGPYPDESWIYLNSGERVKAFFGVEETANALGIRIEGTSPDRLPSP